MLAIEVVAEVEAVKVDEGIVEELVRLEEGEVGLVDLKHAHLVKHGLILKKHGVVRRGARLAEGPA